MTTGSLPQYPTPPAQRNGSQPQSGRVVSLDVYRERRGLRGSLVVPPPTGRRPLTHAAYEDHRIAFLCAARVHERRALTLLLNGRADQAALHHLSALLFRVYAAPAAIRRLGLIDLGDQVPAAPHAVHRNATLFFRAIVEAFFREHAVEAAAGKPERVSVTDDIDAVVAAFRHFGFEQRYNAVVAAFNAQLQRTDHAADDVLMQLERNYRPYLN